MFFTGSLQEGIASAVQQSKCVFCFVTACQVANLLENEAVALRLKQGSEEAGFLAAIFPLPNTPTVVIIKNGDLKEYIVAGTTKDEFVRRATAALQGAQGRASTTAPAPAPAPAPASAPTQPGDDLYDETPYSTYQPPASAPAPAPLPQTSTPAPPAQENENSAAIRAVLAERAARLEAKRIEDERKAKEARAAKAEADNSKQAEDNRSHKEALKKARQDAAEEKARILKKIEDDRAARRAKAAERAALREQESAPKLGEVAAALTRSDSSSLAPSSSAASGMTALQVRLFDGSTLRNRFPSSKTLREDVRKWIDAERTDGSRDPYRFKVVLAPQPSRAIDDTEEDKSLADLGLSPSSTLILAPVGAHVSAYESGVGGAVAKFLLLPLALLQWLWGLISGVFSGLGSRARSDEGAAEPVTVREQRKGKFSQFANPDDRRGDNQLYNGNSLNFEPRPDEKKDE
ncbi:UBX domain-containing protein 4 [Colletotrichum sojae]|uniref:UBX domain-containing protein 4 n=1 Tax=Colletotrichum sojae TaxID=2175907 RepID=A0A8H6MVX8_9PEZI|nr:UBX domain-containing protein 4 [Colletotrichum sojae]